MPGDFRTSNSIVILAVIGLIFVIMASIGYALYIVKSTMNIHLTQKEAQEASRQNNYSVSSSGWKEYIKNEDFSFQYPAAWTVKEDENYLLSLKKLSTKKVGSVESQLLVMTLNFGKIDNSTNLSLEEAIAVRKIKSTENKKINLGGKEVLRTGMIYETALPSDSIYWKGKEGDIYYLESIYYNKESGDSKSIFEEILMSLKFY